jgi:predicted nucleic acid-binding protein
MPYLADTNVLLRWVQPHHALHSMVQAALNALRRQGESVYVTPQNLIEFWNAATRPANRNGFGFTPAEADRELIRLENLFLLAPDSPAIYPAWRRLVASVGVSGVQVHDARLVAAMEVHGLSHILTFNVTDFLRYPSVTVVHPQDLATAP